MFHLPEFRKHVCFLNMCIFEDSNTEVLFDSKVTTVGEMLRDRQITKPDEKIMYHNITNQSGEYFQLEQHTSVAISPAVRVLFTKKAEGDMLSKS